LQRALLIQMALLIQRALMIQRALLFPWALLSARTWVQPYFAARHRKGHLDHLNTLVFR
jgi:hypothetical protein